MGRPTSGTTIGMSRIKHRRLAELRLTSHPDLFVGQCVPFYFCPRSVMLYLIYRANDPDLSYRGGQAPIVHLEADLYNVISWTAQAGHRWAFTLSNAGAYYFEDRCDISRLGEIAWEAVTTNRWSGIGASASFKEGKQAEFLVEYSFPWFLIERIGVFSRTEAQQVSMAMAGATRRPTIEIKADWYY